MLARLFSAAKGPGIPPRIPGAIRPKKAETETTAQIPTFAPFKLHTGVSKFLSENNILSPSPIQTLSCPALMNLKAGGPVFLGAPTGSGKTFSYLLPLVSNLKKIEEQTQSTLRLPFRPVMIVLAPSKELVDQIFKVSKGISHHAKFKAEKVDSAEKWEKSSRNLKEGVDLLVTNLSKYERLVREERIFLSNLRYMVIDEADAFLEAGGAERLIKIIRALEPNDVRFIFVSATLTRTLKEFLDTVFDKRITYKVSTDMHINLANLEHEFLPARGDRLQLLKSLLSTNKEKYGIIFCNSVSCVRAVDHFLKAEGFDVGHLHGEMIPRLRIANVESFQQKKVHFLVASDLVARGMDFPHLDMVVNFDFPRSPNDYIHRSGRAGRIGNTGTVVSFYLNKDIPLLKLLQETKEKKLPVPLTQSSLALRNKELPQKAISDRTEDRFMRVPSQYFKIKQENEKWKEKRLAMKREPKPLPKKIKHLRRKEKQALKAIKYGASPKIIQHLRSEKRKTARQIMNKGTKPEK